MILPRYDVLSFYCSVIEVRWRWKLNLKDNRHERLILEKRGVVIEWETSEEGIRNFLRHVLAVIFISDLIYTSMLSSILTATVLSS